MNNEDRLLKLVLSDSSLCTEYNINAEDYPDIENALKSDNPVVLAIAKIIRNVNSQNRSSYKETYNIIFNHLQNNLL